MLISKDGIMAFCPNDEQDVFRPTQNATHVVTKHMDLLDPDGEFMEVSRIRLVCPLCRTVELRELDELEQESVERSTIGTEFVIMQRDLVIDPLTNDDIHNLLIELHGMTGEQLATDLNAVPDFERP